MANRPNTVTGMAPEIFDDQLCVGGFSAWPAGCRRDEHCAAIDMTDPKDHPISLAGVIRGRRPLASFIVLWGIR